MIRLSLGVLTTSMAIREATAIELVNTRSTLHAANGNSAPVADAAPLNGIDLGDDATGSLSCVDICSLNDDSNPKHYIVLKGNKFIRMKHLNDELPREPDIRDLHKNCKNGDHYIAGVWESPSSTRSRDGNEDRKRKDIRFYILSKDYDCNNLTEVKDLVADNHPRLHKLHSSYQGGDFYFSNGSAFFIIKSNYFLQTPSLIEKPGVKVHRQSLHPDLCHGIYYFATNISFYVIKPDGHHLVYHRTRQLTSSGEKTRIHESLAKILRKRVQRAWPKGMSQRSLTTCTCL